MQLQIENDNKKGLDEKDASATDQKDDRANYAAEFMEATTSGNQIADCVNEGEVVELEFHQLSTEIEQLQGMLDQIT